MQEGVSKKKGTTVFLFEKGKVEMGLEKGEKQEKKRKKTA